MEKRNVLQIILSLILIIVFIYSNNIVYATSINEIINGADKFVDSGKQSSSEVINGQILNDTSDLIYNTLLILGTCIAAIIGLILGIQFMTGSVEQKVKVKESIIPFIVGCVIIFGAFGIWRLVILLIR